VLASPLSYTVPVSQDYGASGALRPSYPNLPSFVLYAFLSSDWCVGNTDRPMLEEPTSWIRPETGFSTVAEYLQSRAHEWEWTVIVFQFNMVITLPASS